MRKHFSLLAISMSLLLLANTSLLAQRQKQTADLLSPDKKTRLELKINDQQQLVYRLLVNKQPVIDWSGLGLQFRSQAISPATTITQKSQRSHKESIVWPLGENEAIDNTYHELTLTCQSGTLSYQVVARLFTSSLAFCYVIPTAKPDLIVKELTSFQLTEPYTIYQYNEESIFTPVSLNDLTKTCDLPATLTNGKLFISIGEAVNDSYTKPVLQKGVTANSLAIGFKKDSVKTGTSFQSPWRTISVATSAIGLHAFSDLPMRLAPPSPTGIPTWIKPGKLIRAALTTQAGLDCIDFAKAHNLQYVMFDAGWYGAEFRGTSDPTQTISAIDMPRVIQYGKEKGGAGNPIGVILYVNRVALRAKLDTILPLYKKWGVAGLKFGFVDGLSQEGINWLAQALPKVLAHGFILDIHDNYKPTGLSRTYPNLLTQEGIRGNENNPDAYHNTVLPFTRFLAGAADYTFCFPNSNQAFSDNLLKNKLQVSKGQQLALSVVYFSPLQAIFWYGNPNDYKNEQEIAFFSRVPTVWNESKYLAGEIGQHISVARRQGATWYLGSACGLSDWSGSVSLDFLDKGKTYTATVYEDDDATSIRQRTVSVKRGDSFPIQLKAKGGQAVVIEPQ